jgi:acetylornithine deacetylase/succinyl-diaminopimelate desuccinylase-like protein
MTKLKPSGASSGIAAQLLQDSSVKRAFEIIDTMSAQLMREHIAICEIPAPTFQEQARGEYFRARFAALGLADVAIDAAGNVTACWPAAANEYVCLSAHLDTVFPADTDCRVRQKGDRYFAPGISDNASGLIGLLAIAEAMVRAGIKPSIPILFVATVCEEGIGDLRGVRHLFNESRYKDKIKYFIAFDGPGIERITHRALGSRRYQVTLRGPGGHSWGDFGIVNPVHALGRAIAKMATYDAPQQPRTSYNIGIIDGGSSVNTIPQKATMQVDLRSVSEQQLSKLEAHLMRSIQEAVAEEHRANAHSDTTVEIEIEMIGHRPSGELSVNATLVQAAIETTRCFGVTPYLECSSTDANIPISMGKEAITIGAGGGCGSCHTLEEWYEATDRAISLKRALLLMLALIGLQ